MATHALHIGINNYAGSENDLAGCLNDARNLERQFGERRVGAVRDAIDMCRFFGNADTQVVVLDRAATRKRVLAEIRALMKKLEKGDWGIFTFSGHGTYVTDASGDEDDGHDEALVTSELDVLLDDVLGEELEKRRAGSRLIVQTDACHSGTGLRSLGPRLLGASDSPHRHRFLPPSRLPQRTRDLRRAAKMKRSSKLVDVIHFAGCRDDQFSADTEFNRMPQGAHTHYWTYGSLCNLPAGATFGDWTEALAKQLPNHTFDQCPQTNAFQRMLDLKIPTMK